MQKLKMPGFFVGLFIVISVWFGAVEATASGYNYQYVTQWNFTGSNIYGLTTDTNGNVYVTVDNSIQKFDGNGNPLAQWGSYGTGNGQFSDAMNPAVDASGNVYVPDLNNSRVQKFDRNGNYLLQWGSRGSGIGQFNWPYAAAVDKNGYVYISDQTNNRIQKFDSNGNYVATIGAGQIQPYCVAIDASGNIFTVAPFYVTKFSSNGSLLAQWGSQGSGNGQFNWAYGIAVDAAGNVYVADGSNNRVQIFDNNGNYLSQFGTAGSGNGQFNYDGWIAVDTSGNVYTGEREGHRIQKFANVIATISGTPSTTDTAGTYYSFTPSAYDINGNPLTFSISNKPSWATFNPSTGTLSGTPVAGTYSNIQISVSDGNGGSASLSPFSINVASSGGTPVPVMDGWWLLPGMLAGLGMIGRRRKQ
jgi:tripartite motif-containing protein 71